MSKLKIGMAGFLSAALGFVVQGCFATQPPPECTVVTSAGSPYYVKLDKTDSAGTCTDVVSSDIDHMWVGMQRFTNATDKKFSIYVRTDYVPALVGGELYGCNDDLTNDCTNPKAPGACRTCVIGSGAAAHFADGGSAVDPNPLSDGGVQGVVYGDGGTKLADGGIEPIRVSLTNKCSVTQEGVAFVDSTDPDGKNIDNVYSTTLYPVNGVCAMTATSGGVQNLDAYTCADGTAFPAMTVKTEFNNLEVIDSAKAPSTYWTSTFKITEGSCVTNYTALGFWPAIDCHKLDENGDPVDPAEPDESLCDPNPNVDAGQVVGSGISPNFKPKCDTTRFICVPTATAAELKK